VGDRLRQIFYPMILPLIVATVWMCGWARQQEDGMARAVFSRPAGTAAAYEVFVADAEGDTEFDADADVAAEPAPGAQASPVPRPRAPRVASGAFATIAPEPRDEP